MRDRAQTSAPSETLERVTVRDLAEAAGVSMATVSRVLNGHPDVSEKTREHVTRLARSMGLSGSRVSRMVKRTDLVGITLPIVHAEYFAQIMSGAAEALYEHDVRFVLCPTQHQHDREVSLLQRLIHGTTDGSLLVLPAETPEELAGLQEYNYPVVVVDPRYALPESVPVVSAAHTAGARAAVSHLLELGHRRIATITGTPGWCATAERIDGYYATMATAGIMPRPEWIVEGDFQIESGYAAAERLIRLAEPPTAIFALNDNMAIGAIKAMRHNGVLVPEDISIVGFDDAEIASVVSPGLTTVRQPLQEMGRVAASLLLRLLNGRPMEATRLELATKLIVRASTAPPRS